MKYTDEELREAFEKVQNKKHWKNPINAVCLREDQDVITEAVIYFAGCVPTFTPIGTDKLRCRAVGYYIAVGS